MVVVISGPEFWGSIDEALVKLNKEIGYKKIDRDIDIMGEVERLTSMTLDFLVLDISCLDDHRRVPQAIRKLMINKENLRVIIIAPQRFSGNEVISNLISMGIYDIIGQRDNEEKNIAPALIEHFQNPSTYAKAIKWDDGFARRKEQEKEFIETGSGRFGKNSGGNTQAKMVEKDKIVGTVVIAVVGTMSRIGTTHTAISIAKYLMDNRHGVAVVELHSSFAFDCIKNSYDNVVEKNGMFSLGGMDFYPFDPARAVSDLVLDDYSYIILDMGVYGKCNIAEFRRAQERVIVSGVKDWELNELEELIESEDKNFKNRYYFTFSNNAMFELVKESMNSLPCFQAPYNPQPFDDSDECAKVFGNMLRNVMPQINSEDENESFLKYMLKKKEIKLYHKPILVDKIMLRNAQANSKPVISTEIKKYLGVIRFIISMIIVAIALTLLYYLFSKTTVFSQIRDFFKGIY
ncbi:hypothetical protein [Acetivibrio cellulolyticus]|uniref:hypothetical protein n=1 Tax=Acetivibrio cellulolyticus TaxID=35830 RepID=UPI0002481C63|nr:hypothetical protein [Acetivibrio cellulolyticus]